MMRKHGGEQRD